MENAMYIYCIENKVNGKKYVGQTSKSIERRFREHIKKAKTEDRQAIHDAIRKHGAENFSVSLLELIDSYESALEREMYWVRELQTKTDGYNETDGGEGSYGRCVSEVTKQKHRKNAIKRYEDGFATVISDSIKKLHNERGLNYWSEEGLKKMKKTLYPPDFTGKRMNAKEVVEKRTASMRNSKLMGKYERSKETRKKLSDSRKGKFLGKDNPMSSEENRKKVGESKIGRKKMYSPEKTEAKYIKPEQFRVFQELGWSFANDMSKL
jgi:group I intron endonuclease